MNQCQLTDRTLMVACYHQLVRSQKGLKQDEIMLEMVQKSIHLPPPRGEKNFFLSIRTIGSFGVSLSGKTLQVGLMSSFSTF